MHPFPRLFGLGALATALVLSAAPGEEGRSVARTARAVLKQHCYRCHNGPGSESGYAFDVLKDATLKARFGDDGPVVVPGKPAESLLFVRSGIRKTMPPRSVRERPSDGELTRLKRWIEAGAPAFPTQDERKFISRSDVLTAVRNHLRNAERGDRSHLRYFTLTHLHTNPAVPDEDLRIYRAALSKALNSLSWKRAIVLPEAIDREGTLLAIDLRRFGWDRHELWQEVIRAYPYGLKYGNHPDARLRQLDKEISELTDCELPVVRADWFTATATRPPLYHVLLRLPRKASELEKQLQVNVAANFREEKLVRAGFTRSGISGQNRLVERHDAAHGAYWKSYDFKPNSGRAKLTRFPLGPLNLFPPGEHPFAKQAFVHAGSEILFNLPNGLQGYLLVDELDERIDEAPINVVGDGTKTSGTPAIVNGLSCMACHKHGMIRFSDSIRASSAVFGQAEEKVRRLYPEAKKMAKLVAADQRRFLSALEKAVGPFLRVGPDRESPLKDFAEPVGEVARLYRLSHLDLKMVACELDQERPTELIQKVGAKRLKHLGLEALLQPGGVVSRAEWEAVDAISLMQEVARELRATPIGPASPEKN